MQLEFKIDQYIINSDDHLSEIVCMKVWLETAGTKFLHW